MIWSSTFDCSLIEVLISHPSLLELAYFSFLFANFITNNSAYRLLFQADYIHFFTTGQSSFDIPEFAPDTDIQNNDPLNGDALEADTGSSSRHDNSSIGLPTRPSSPPIPTVLKRMQSSEFSLILPELPLSRPASRPPSANSLSPATCLSTGPLSERDSTLPGTLLYQLCQT